MTDPQGTLQVLLNREGIVLDSSSGLNDIATKITKIGGYVRFMSTDGHTDLCAITEFAGCNKCVFYNTGKCPRPQSKPIPGYAYCCRADPPCMFVKVEYLLEEL